jgi:hypothetical protein
LLIEETRTNSIIQSSTYSNAAWTKVGVVSVSTTYSPTNAFNAEVIVTLGDNATAVRSIIPATLPLTPTVSSPYTMSGYFKTGSFSSYTGQQYMQMAFSSSGFGAAAYLNIDTVNGLITATGASIISSSITHAGNGWWIVTATANATVAAPSGVRIYFVPNYNSVVADPLLSESGFNWAMALWGTQLEAGAFATSYIPTTTAAVTRNADGVTVSTLTHWFNLAQGTFIAKCDIGSFTNSPTVIGLGGVYGFNDTTGNARWWNGTTNVSTANTTAINATRKEAFAYAASARDICLNAGTVATDANVPWAVTPTTMAIGSLAGATSQSINGHVQSISYYNVRLPNATLQGLTV